MRAGLAALCAALLCIPASLVVGYRIGQDDGPSALEDNLAAKTEAFFRAYNSADEKTVCEIVTGDFMGFYGPGSCQPVYSEPTAPADRLTARVLEVVQVDGNSAVVIANVAVGKEKPQASTLLYELTKDTPAGDYRSDSAFELKKGKKPQRKHAAWRIVGVV